MDGLGQILAFGMGSLCLGAALALGLIVALLNRGDHDWPEGCLGLMLFLIPFTLGIYFFMRALGAMA